ncbi:MAG: M24 family metallopeptidase [Betaproteobacteria bacterium]
MISRRTFMWLTGAAAGLSVTRVSAQRRGAMPAGPVPPPIAKLTSLRSQATPISVDERRARIEKARRLMGEAGLDAILLAGGTSLVYFTGMRWGGGERLFAVVLPAKGDPFCVCPGFEEDRAREQLALGPLKNTEVLIWQEDESPFERVAQGLRSRGIASGRLGVEETTKFVFADSVASAAPSLHVVSATPVTAGCRMIKDAHEIALMRLACRATLTCYEAVYRALQPGMTQNQVSALVGAAYGRLGFPGFASVQVGEYTALPHGSITPQTIREGTIIMIDDGCNVEGYQSDITRTFVLGKATDKMKRVFDIVHRAQSAALSAARPGVPLESIDAAARKVIVDAGYGPAFKYFSHRVGHGIGMDGHEWPYLVKNNMFGWTKALTLQPNMTFSDEPGVYIKGEFGVRLEDDMHVTEDGAELLTPQSPSIEEPFGSGTSQ